MTVEKFPELTPYIHAPIIAILEVASQITLQIKTTTIFTSSASDLVVFLDYFNIYFEGTYFKFAFPCKFLQTNRNVRDHRVVTVNVWSLQECNSNKTKYFRL